MSIELSDVRAWAIEDVEDIDYEVAVLALVEAAEAAEALWISVDAMQHKQTFSEPFGRKFRTLEDALARFTFRKDTHE